MREGWKRCPLGSVCELISGQHIAAKDYNTKGSGIGYLTGPSDFGDQYPIISKWTEHPKRTAKPGDILITVKGSGVGSINLLVEEEVAISRQLMAIRVIGASRRYVHAFLKLTFPVLRRMAVGAAIPGLSRGNVLGLEIPLPPLSEQKRIVAILDEAFAGIDAAIANTEKNLKNARELFESYLNSTFTQSHDNGWIKKRLHDLTTKIGSGATPRGGRKAYKKEGVSLIRSMNVHDRRFKFDKLAFIDDQQAERLDHVAVAPGDVLFNITGASIARSCLAPGDVLPARVNQHVAIIRPREDALDSNFLCYLLTSRAYKEVLLEIGERGSTRQAITKAQLQELKIGFPPEVDRQREIVSLLDGYASEVSRLEAQLERKVRLLAELRQSILRKAFTGELTGDRTGRDVAAA